MTSTPRAERTVLLALLAAFCLLRMYWIFQQEFNTDEAQHLHVCWEWTEGRVAYRDFFDNHTPIFQWTMAPVIAAVGERADIQVLARLAMLPLFLATLWATFALGRAVFGVRIAAWGALLFSAEWAAFNHSIEFRPDALWTLLWILALLVLLRGPLTLRRAFAGGLLVGLAFGVSLKSTLLLPTLGVAALLAPVTCPGLHRGVSLRKALSIGAVLLAGVLVVPAAIAVSFAAVGAWRSMAYCLVGHNLTADPYAPLGERVAYFLGVVILGVAFLRWVLSRLRLEGDRRRQAILVGSALIHFAAAGFLWPLRQMQTFLPAWPVVALAFAAMFVAAARAIASYISRRAARGTEAPPAARPGWEVLLLAAFLLAGTAARMAPKFGRPLPHMAELQTAVVQDVLQLTDHADYVMDPKGTAIFRRRPFYFALERISMNDLNTGVLKDDIVERMIATRTCVAIGPFQYYPARSRAWIERFTVPVAGVRVAGSFLPPHLADPRNPLDAAAPEARAFETAVPAKYAIVVEGGTASGTLDGRPYAGARFLEPGRHVYDPGAALVGGAGRVAVLWAQAVDRGFSPFAAVRRVR